MPALLEKPHTTEQPEVTTTSKLGKLLPISFALVSISIIMIVASLQNPNKTDEEQFEELQSRVDQKFPLEDFEKIAYCDLLWKLKKVRLCACKKNFIKDIGSLTGYEVKPIDLDWRDSGKTFEEALQEAFRRTGVPKEEFSPNEWAKDINGKSGVVEWKGPRGAEVSVDAPHEKFGPDVFHVGFQTPGKKEDRVRGHIFLDCVPYFRK